MYRIIIIINVLYNVIVHQVVHLHRVVKIVVFSVSMPFSQVQVYLLPPSSGRWGIRMLLNTISNKQVFAIMNCDTFSRDLLVNISLIFCKMDFFQITKKLN